MTNAQDTSCSIPGLAAQVAAIIAAALIAQRQADQDVDEADMSLAYSGGSGRVRLSSHCPILNSNGLLTRWYTACHHGLPGLPVHGCHDGGATPWRHKTPAIAGFVLYTLTCSVKLDILSVHAPHISW